MELRWPTFLHFMSSTFSCSRFVDRRMSSDQSICDPISRHCVSRFSCSRNSPSSYHRCRSRNHRASSQRSHCRLVQQRALQRHQHIRTAACQRRRPERLLCLKANEYRSRRPGRGSRLQCSNTLKRKRNDTQGSFAL